MTTLTHKATAVILLCLAVAACRKEKTSPEITCTGYLEEGSEVTFSYPARAGSSYAWVFEAVGKYSPVISAEPSPTCIFYSAGTVKAILIINNDSLHKIEKTITIAPALDFAVKGTCIPGKTLAFNCNKQSNGLWLWNFGDNATSSKESPTHVYADTGIYKVTLTVDGKRTKTKDVRIVNDPEYTHLIAGQRNWHRSLKKIWSNGITGTFNSDTSFYVDVIDEINISALGYELMYVPEAIDSALVYKFYESSVYNLPKVRACTLTFNYISNKISYHIFIYHALGLQTTDDYISE